MTALGVGFLAGLGTLYPSVDYIRGQQSIFKTYQPKMKYKDAINDYEGWKKAVSSAQTYK